MKNIDKRQAVLDATLKLITENGFHGTPMSMVAEKAGVATGSIYYYFESKEQIIRELYANIKKKMGEALLENIDESKNFKEQFFKVWKNLYHFFVSHPQEFNFLEQYSNSPFINQQVKEENFRFYKPVIDFIQTGIDKGVLREIHIELMVALLYGSVTSVVKLQLSNILQIEEHLLQDAIQSSWDGVKII